MKLAGSTIANITANVGEQLVNTGHNEAHNNISQYVHHLDLDFWSSSLDFSNHNFVDIFVHICGNIINIQNHINIIADIVFQKSWLNHIARLQAFNNSVNIIIETTNDHTIITGLYHLLLHKDHQIITGNNGNTHGASTVSIQASKDSHNIIILLKYRLN